MKSRIILILLLLGIGVSIFYLFINRTAPADINAFALKSKSTDKILLYKNHLPSGGFIKAFNGEWMLKNGTKIDQHMASQMFKLLKEVKIKSQVAVEKQKEIAKMLKQQGFVIEYYQENYLSKAFFIGTVPGKDSYSYAMIEGEEVPYLIYIPKSNNSLVRLFSLPEIDWKDRTLFDSKPENIVTLKVEYFENTEDSFLIKNDFKKFNLAGSSKLNTEGLKKYLKEFENFKAGTLISHNEILLDSIKLSRPFCRITLDDIDPYKNNSVSFYACEANKEIFYAQVGESNDVFIISSKKVNSLIIKRKQLS